MLNKEKHQLIMGRILQDIYRETSIAPILGFKGGTCAYLFYGLTRFSVDLDFDLLKSDETTQKIVFEKVTALLLQYGQVKDSFMKRNTIFFLLSYGDADHNVKVEVNIRVEIPAIQSHFELKEYLGISMPIARKPYMFASKLAALTDRKETAARDIYDIWFFAKSNWEFDQEILKQRTGKSAKEYLTDCITVIEQVKDNQMLQGLGELLDGEKQKAWVKSHLREDVILLLKNYMAALQ